MAEVDIAGRRLAVSNLSKVLYPEAGFTKANVIDYYVRVSPALLPHLRDRPLTLKRYPDGVRGGFFYEKRCPPYRPRWVKTVPVYSRHRGETIRYCVANDVASLVWLANLADIELHTSLSLYRDMERPTMMVFDLDPGAPAALLDCCEVALLLESLLERLGLECFPKTSGSKGLQVCVPLNGPVSYDETKPFAHEVARALERRHPERITSVMKKSLRPGKVFVDWSQNDEHKTTVCVYSLRARERPTVSTPVTWAEVRRAVRRRDASGLTLEADAMVRRLEREGDRFEPVLKLVQRLPPVEAVG